MAEGEPLHLSRSTGIQSSNLPPSLVPLTQRTPADQTDFLGQLVTQSTDQWTARRVLVEWG